MNKKLVLLTSVCVLALAWSFGPPSWAQHDGNSAASPAGIFTAEVTDISGTNYLPIVHRELGQATTSIHVAMYLMSANSRTMQVGTLMDDLIAAHGRGVDVTVILDRSYKYRPDRRQRELDTKNDAAYAILAKAGVNVRFASPGRTVHGKLLVIDGHTVICGSANWSQRALTRNAEFGALIRAREYAVKQLEAILAIKTVEAPEYIDIGRENSLHVPGWFLTDKDAAPAMMSENDERAFDLFLLILRKDLIDTQQVEAEEEEDTEEEKEEPPVDATPITVNYDDVAVDLGMTNMTRTAYRRQITKTLRKLEKRYGLIECQFKYNRPASVTLRKASEEDGINVPSGYWDYGWSRSLGLGAKFAYLVCIYKRENSKSKPSWTESLGELSEEFHVAASTIGEGLRALEEEGLLKIDRSSAHGGAFLQRQANRYLLNPLPSQAERAKQWSDLIAINGKDAVERAQKLASLLNQERNPDTVAGFIRIID
jgi:hypothetical protein